MPITLVLRYPGVRRITVDSETVHWNVELTVMHAFSYSIYNTVQNGCNLKYCC